MQNGIRAVLASEGHSENSVAECGQSESMYNTLGTGFRF